MGFFLSLIFNFNMVVFAEPWQGQIYLAGTEADVYAQPSESSKVIYRLHIGDQVSIGSSSSNNFRAVKFKAKGKIRNGYIVGKEVVDWSLKSDSQNISSRKSIYFSLVESYQRQSERNLQTGSESIYEVGEFSGLSTYFAAGMDFPYGEGWAIRLGLVMRRTSMEGDAHPDTAPTQRYLFSLEQEFIGAEAGLRYRPKAWGLWSFMALAEFSKGTNVNLKVLEGPAITNGDIDLPYFMIFSGAVLYDKKISRNFSFEPAIRLGVVATADPIILLGEGLLSLRYHF